MKRHPHYHQGIEYIRLSLLPFQQYSKFLSWISPLSIFKLNVDNEVLDDCVPYSEYDYWYEMHIRETSTSAFSYIL